MHDQQIDRTTLCKAILKNDLSMFIGQVVESVDPAANYLHNWHIELIAEYLRACQKGDITRLIINIPPRHLKSISVAVAFPAWLLGHNPSEQIMCASYSQELSFKHSLDCRLVMQNPWYQQLFPGTQLVEDQNTKRKFATTERGYRIATSVGGTATGEGGNFLIVDDPINALQGQSEAMRGTANTWFDQTFSNRLNDKKKGCIIIIMQRLHEEDLTGHLLKKGGWDHLCLPMVAEEETLLQKGTVRKVRQVGEYLHPERMGDAEIEREKNSLGPYGFSGQYQQSPSPEGGGEFRKDWIQYYDTLTLSTLNKYILVDPANSKAKSSDYTAICVIGVGPDQNIYVIDWIRDKLNVRERADALFDLHAKYRPLGVAYEKYGMQTDSDWLRVEMEHRNYRFHITEVGGSITKEARIRRLIPYFYNSKIYLPRALYKANYENKQVEIIDQFIHQEYLTFPVGLHDDMLDALSRLCDITMQYPGRNAVDYYNLYK
jgi:predicted phage terminase large subunit-like protein